MITKKTLKEFLARMKALFVGLWRKLTGHRPINPPTGVDTAQLRDLVSKLINCCDE